MRNSQTGEAVEDGSDTMVRLSTATGQFHCISKVEDLVKMFCSVEEAQRDGRCRRRKLHPMKNTSKDIQQSHQLRTGINQWDPGTPRYRPETRPSDSTTYRWKKWQKYLAAAEGRLFAEGLESRAAVKHGGGSEDVVRINGVLNERRAGTCPSCWTTREVCDWPQI